MVTTMEQLNLFHIEEEIKEKNTNVNEKISPNDGTEELVVQVQQKLETFTSQGSLLKDDRDELFQSNQTTQFQVMDKVKIVLISEELDSETHNYRKYYEPHFIGKVGEVTKVIVSSKGKVTYEVDVYGEKSIFEEAELLWIG